MIAILTRKSGVVIAKEVYQGDTSKLASILAARIAADGTLTFQQFADDQDPTYVAATVTITVPVDPNWSTTRAAIVDLPTAKQAILFLAKRLGLE